MFDEPIKEAGTFVKNEETRFKNRVYHLKRKAEKEGRELTAEEIEAARTPKPSNAGRPKGVVNRVTEYGALFNTLNEERIEAGLPPLKTAMEVLIEAMQSHELDIKEKAKIAEKLANFESSRAPTISIEHVQNVQKTEEADADESMADFLNSLKKV
jgi:phosphopantetheine adenylyltransferase